MISHTLESSTNVEEHGFNGTRNYSVFEFDCPADSSREIVTMIGRGYAFSESWSMDDTFSFLIEGTLEGLAEKEMSDLGVEARQDSKPIERSETQTVDVYDSYNPSDPANW